MTATEIELRAALDALRLEAQHFLQVNKPCAAHRRGEKFLIQAIERAVEILEKK